MIHRERVFQEFMELVQVDCPTLGERQIGDLLTKRLMELGCTVEEDDAGKKLGGTCGNLIALFPGNVKDAPTILLAAHMDCVEPCRGVKPRRDGDRIVSDGTTILGADDKAGVVAILETLRVLKEKNIPHGDVQIVLAVAEEGGVNGSKNLAKDKLRADFGYALDSSGRPGKIIVRAPGNYKINVKVHGKTAHAGLAPETGVNAIVAAAQMIVKLPQGRIDEETTCNIGVCNGGRATNIVPDLVEIRCEARSRDQKKLDDLTEKICNVFRDNAADQHVQVDVDVVKSYGPYVLDENSRQVQLAVKAAQALGLKTEITGTGGGSDANSYNGYGVPCTVLAVGMQKAHTTEEFILEEDLYAAAQWVLTILSSAAKK